AFPPAASSRCRRRRLRPMKPRARSAGSPEPARTPPPQSAPTATTTASSRGGLPFRETARRETRARLIQNHRDHDCATDDDPLVILIEMQSPDGLADEDNEHGSQTRGDRASPTAAQ